MSKKISINPSRMTDRQRRAVFTAIKQIASYCDGAAKQDGMGFNKNDTDFGKKLASLDSMSSKQLTYAARLSYKYRRQLDLETRAIIESLETLQLPLIIDCA